ncbi:substrate-binding domain-containing protein [Demequina litorisediminis]|uniref:Transcriptional regulator LacI/GalR-like sensor domain-containing protein n=1 Tax=Demequina litorisediminis TaxID=1849022 RepID=A0ABQ6ID66_9MICO|nr:substrate-binding domain-containing protein [Demequina litorisediminis]GMA35798.1 hypothetical protein GCM10025876_20020 [Demequina litorisediminis]
MITDAVLRAAQAEGYGVTLVTVEDAAHDGWTPAANRLRHQTVDGLIIIRSEGHSTEQLALPPGMPVAVSDSRVHGVYPCVVSDELGSQRMAVEHLLELGHRTVHYVAGPADSEPARLRRAGWHTALVQAGAEVPEPYVGDWTADSGFAGGTALASDPSVTAIACANDETAFGVLAALHEAGRHVPDDVSVIGFDDVSLSRFTQPPLTTVKQHFTAIGNEPVPPGSGPDRPAALRGDSRRHGAYRVGATGVDRASPRGRLTPTPIPHSPDWWILVNQGPLDDQNRPVRRWG